MGRRTRKQLVGRTEAADWLASDKQLRRLRREIKAARRVQVNRGGEVAGKPDPDLVGTDEP